MSYLLPFTIEGITYVDSRGPMDAQARSDAMSEFNRLTDQHICEWTARNELEVPSGFCGKIQRSQLQMSYLTAFEAGETELSYEQWRDEAESKLSQETFYQNEGFLAFAFDGDRPVGGVPVIDVLLDRFDSNGELRYNAIIPPILEKPEYAAQLYEHILGNALAAHDDHDQLFYVRLTRIRCPDADTRNRLLTHDRDVLVWVSQLHSSQVSVKQADGQEFLSELRPLHDGR